MIPVFYRAVTFGGFLILSGCANPLNQATAERYSETCFEAERNGRLEVAEEACRRALINVDIGHLGELQKSQKMYNYARVKRRLGKYQEAEGLFKQSLEIEEKQTPPSNERIGRRLAELAIVVAELKKFDDGLPYVEKLLPLADQYTGDERKTVATIFGVYAEQLKKSNSKNPVVAKIAKKATDMGFDPKELSK